MGVNTTEPATKFSRGAVRIVFCARLTLCDRYVVCCLNESGELFIGNVGLIHPEPIDVHAMPGFSVWHVVVVGPHPELAAGNPDHSRGFGSRRLTVIDSWQPSILSRGDDRGVRDPPCGLCDEGSRASDTVITIRTGRPKCCIEVSLMIAVDQ